MARTLAKLLVAVWRDPEWLNLTQGAQWLYEALLSQPKLTLVGSLDVTIPKWACLARDLTPEAVAAALDELHEARFVVHDQGTGEVLIRSFTVHDLDPNRCNSNLVKGLWGQWGAIASPHLRSLAIWGMPDAIWAKVEALAPHDAVKIRRSRPLEPEPPTRSEPEPPARFEPPPSSHHPPVTCRPPADDTPVAADFEHHAPARIPDDLAAQGLGAVTALRERFQPRDHNNQDDEEPPTP